MARPAALVIGSGPVRIGQGIEFDYCAVQAAEALRARGLAGGDGQLEPGDRLDRLRRLLAAVLRAARRRRACWRSSAAETPPGDGAAARPRPVRGPDAAQPGGVPGRARACPCPGCRSRPSTWPRSGRASPASSTGWASRSPRAASRPRSRRRSRWPSGWATRSSCGPSLRHRRPGHRLLLRARRTWRASWRAATVVNEDRPVRIDAYLEGLEVDVDAVCDGTDVLIPGLMEHVERAGVHSGDSVAVFPPQRLVGGRPGLIVDAMTPRRAGASGCAASSTPSSSSATTACTCWRSTRAPAGRCRSSPRSPACRWSSWRRAWRWARLAGGAGLVGRPAAGARPVVAVKAPVFSTAKLRGVDPALGPGMQSTGEVIGLHRTRGVALAKALLAAALRPPLPGADGALALLSIADRDKAPCRSWPRRSRSRGLPVRRHRRDGARAARGWATRSLEVAPLGEAGPERRARPSSTHRERPGVASSSTRPRRARARSATRRPSATRRSRRASCASRAWTRPSPPRARSTPPSSRAPWRSCPSRSGCARSSRSEGGSQGVARRPLSIRAQAP